MKRKKPAPTRSSREVEAAIKKLREFHDIGHRSLKNLPENRGYGSSLAKAEAQELGMNEDTLRKARQFADLYPDDDLGELISLCRQHEFALTTTYIIQFVRVPVKHERCRLQEKVIAKHWKTTKLRRAITSRYGPRRAGGRRPAIPDDKTGLLSQIEAMCDSWLRWHFALKAEPDGNGKKAAAALLPTALLKKVDGTVAQLRKLQRAVGRQLKVDRPSRLPKIAIHEERERTRNKGD
jgi:hypothetical protein